MAILLLIPALALLGVLLLAPLMLPGALVVAVVVAAVAIFHRHRVRHAMHSH